MSCSRPTENILLLFCGKEHTTIIIWDYCIPLNEICEQITSKRFDALHSLHILCTNVIVHNLYVQSPLHRKFSVVQTIKLCNVNWLWQRTCFLNCLGGPKSHHYRINTGLTGLHTSAKCLCIHDKNIQFMETSWP